MENKQTAVEFLLSRMWTTDWVNYSREEKIEVIEQAKQLEEQQKREEYLRGYKEGINSGSTYYPD